MKVIRRSNLRLSLLKLLRSQDRLVRLMLRKLPLLKAKVTRVPTPPMVLQLPKQ